jgi:5S rRNA maturation endonuclease (ribonuclease M5)
MLGKDISNKVPTNWIDTLSSLGYSLTKIGDNTFHTKAVYRSGDSPRSIAIYGNTGTFYDFPKQRKGTIAELIALTKNVSVEEVNEILEYQERSKISFEQAFNFPKTYNEPKFLKLPRNYIYFENRGISRTIQEKFECRFVNREKFAGRVIFPIRDFNNQIIGITGRSLTWKDNDRFPKWLHCGPKRFFVYNHRLATKAIRGEGIVIILESVGDALSFSQVGIDNTLCTFGLDLNKATIQYLISLNPRIIISTNNDENGRGKEGAGKIQDKLVRNFFSVNSVNIVLPTQFNDWNEALVKAGEGYLKNWYKSVKNNL